MLSGRGLCDELITRPEESYRLCCVVVCDLETSRIGAIYIYNVRLLRVKKKILLRNLKRRPGPTQGCRAHDDDDEYSLQSLGTLSDDTGVLCVSYAYSCINSFLMYIFRVKHFVRSKI